MSPVEPLSLAIYKHSTDGEIERLRKVIETMENENERCGHKACTHCQICEEIRMKEDAEQEAAYALVDTSDDE